MCIALSSDYKYYPIDPEFYSHQYHVWRLIIYIADIQA
jgi:hypothetical protein